MASEKAKFAQPPFSQQDITALNRLAREWTQKSKEMKGKRTQDGMNAEWEAASIAAHLYEIADLAKSGQAHRAYAKVRTSAPAVQKIMPASLLRAAEEAKKFSRPGAKARFAVEDRFYFGKGRKERFGIEDRVDSLIAGAYRALKNGDKSAAKRMIREAEVLASSEPTLPANILNDLKDLKKSMRF